MQSNAQPNLNLYRSNQQELQIVIKNLLDRKKIPYVESKGNIYSVRFPERPLFVAHMDTVGEMDVKQKLTMRGGKLKRKGSYVLGADDKAGVDILLKNIDDINFCFTVDEEIGCTGAQDLAVNQEFLKAIQGLPCAVEYDRRGSRDLIAYCGADLIEHVEYLTNYKTTEGLFTDITHWDHLIPGVNLSVGYHNPHTGNEYLDLDQWRTALATLPVLNKELRGEYEVEPQITGYAEYGYDDWESDYYYGERFCESCGNLLTSNESLYHVPGSGLVCSFCLEDMTGIYRVS